MPDDTLLLAFVEDGSPQILEDRDLAQQVCTQFTKLLRCWVSDFR